MAGILKFLLFAVPTICSSSSRCPNSVLASNAARGLHGFLNFLLFTVPTICSSASGCPNSILALNTAQGVDGEHIPKFLPFVVLTSCGSTSGCPNSFRILNAARGFNTGQFFISLLPHMLELPPAGLPSVVHGSMPTTRTWMSASEGALKLKLENWPKHVEGLQFSCMYFFFPWVPGMAGDQDGRDEDLRRQGWRREVGSRFCSACSGTPLSAPKAGEAFCQREVTTHRHCQVFVRKADGRVGPLPPTAAARPRLSFTLKPFVCSNK